MNHIISVTSSSSSFHTSTSLKTPVLFSLQSIDSQQYACLRNIKLWDIVARQWELIRRRSNIHAYKTGISNMSGDIGLFWESRDWFAPELRTWTKWNFLSARTEIVGCCNCAENNCTIFIPWCCWRRFWFSMRNSSFCETSRKLNE